MAKFNLTDTDKLPKVVKLSLPWLAGIGIGAGQILASSRCTVPDQGQCSQCGSCVIAVGSLAVWAFTRRKDPEPFYIAKSD